MFSLLLKPLAFLSAGTISLLGLLSTKSRKARYWLHLTLYLGTMGFCSFLGVVYSISLSLIGQRLNINFLTARSFYYLCYPLIGMPLEVEGREHLDQLLTSGLGGKSQSAVLVGNHQSFLDILYLGRIFPKKAVIMAKKELRWAPLLGQYLTLSGAVMVDRKNSRDAVKMMNQAGDDMKRKGVSLWIFPEGTRNSSLENTMLPFKKGAFHLAIQAAVPIVPVVCENYNRLFDGKTRFERGPLRIKVLPPISTAGLTGDDVQTLANTVRDKMIATLKEISHPGPSQLGLDTDDENVPLTGAGAGDSFISAGTTASGPGYGSIVEGGELRRRVSANASDTDVDAAGKTNPKKEMAEAGALDEGVTLGVPAAITGQVNDLKQQGEGEGTEDELDDEGAVLVRRPE